MHEHLCVFSDRLVEEEDCEQLKAILGEVLEQEFNLRIAELLVPTKPVRNYDDTRPEPRMPSTLLFGNFLEPHAVNKQYQELTDYDKVL